MARAKKRGSGAKKRRGPNSKGSRLFSSRKKKAPAKARKPKTPKKTPKKRAKKKPEAIIVQSNDAKNKFCVDGYAVRDLAEYAKEEHPEWTLHAFSVLLEFYDEETGSVVARNWVSRPYSANGVDDAAEEIESYVENLSNNPDNPRRRQSRSAPPLPFNIIATCIIGKAQEKVRSRSNESRR